MTFYSNTFVRPKRNHGFSMIELMVTLSIVAIFLVVAVPSYTIFVKNSRITQESDGLFTLLNQARQTAVSKGRRAYLCIEGAGAPDECDDAFTDRSWAGTKKLYTLPVSISSVAPNNNFTNQTIDSIGAALTGAEVLLAIISETPTGHPSITVASSDDDVVLVYSSQGRLLNQVPMWFAVCDDRDNPEEFGKLIGVSDVGRVTMTSLLDSNGDNRVIDCGGNI